MLTFQIIQRVSQHFKNGHIERITEGFVVEMQTRIQLLKELKQTISQRTNNVDEEQRSVCGPTSRTSPKPSSRDFRNCSETNCSTCLRGNRQARFSV